MTLTPGRDLDLGDASGAPGPFNQRLETSSLISLISFALASAEKQASRDATRRLKHAALVPVLVPPPAFGH